MPYENLQVSRAVAVTPDDDNDIALPTSVGDDPLGRTNRGALLYVGTGGTVAVITAAGDTVSFVGIVAGTFIPVHVKRVLETSTASNIIALW